MTPPLREWERLVRLVLHEPRLHRHQVDVAERVAFKVLEESRAPFALYWSPKPDWHGLVEKLDECLPEVAIRLDEVAEAALREWEHLVRLVVYESRLHQH